MEFRTRNVHHVPAEERRSNSFHVENRPQWKHRVKKIKPNPPQTTTKGSMFV